MLFLILEVIPHILILLQNLILRVIPTKDAKTEMETRQVTVEALISWCLI